MKEGLLSLIALAVLIALIWFGGGYLHWTVGARVLGIVIALAVWLGIYLVQRLLAIRSSMMIERRLRAQAQEQIASSRPMEREKLSDLERRLNEAIQALKSSKRGAGALAELPWYIIIGPPGSGKSTALQKSGLNFPQVNQALNGIAGIGGTRNCEWWFTDDGILLDTAGRYTTEEEDREEWLGFLDMIKNARTRKPINGALVAISVPEILQASEQELEQHVKAVRARLDELCNKLETVFPVYLMFTKCDLLYGFVDFFEDLGKEQRGQVWGYTFPYRQLTADVYRESFVKETQHLYARLCQLRLEPLAVDRHEVKKQNIYSFPLQFLTATRKLEHFVAGLSRTSSFQQEQAIFRGFYFTSGTQEGTPIDQVLASMRDAFGVEDDPNKAPAEEKVEKKSYFIHQLFTRIIFADEGLARSSAAAAKRRKRARLAAVMLTGAATLLVVVSLIVSFVNNQALVNQLSEQMHEVHKTRTEQPKHLGARLEALAELRKGVEKLYQIDERLTGAPYSLSWGLYQGDGIDPKAREIYFGELRSLLIDPCVEGLVKEMRAMVAPGAKPDALMKKYSLKFEQDVYELLSDMLSVYKMLSDRIAGRKELMSTVLRDRNRWLLGMRGDEEKNPPAALAEIAWRQFEFFTTQLRRPGDWAVDPDDELIIKVEKVLNANYWITKTYTQIRDIRKEQVGSESLESLMGDKSGGAKKLFDLQADLKISQVYNASEWEAELEKAINEKAADLAQRYEEMGKPKEKSEIQELLKRYYEDDARSSWKRWIDNLHVGRSETLREATDRLGVLADPERTPLKRLFQDIWPRQNVFEVEETKSKILSEEAEAAADDKEQRTWYPFATGAFAGLHDALDKYVDESSDGKRFAPLAEKDELSALNPIRDAFAACWDQLFDVVIPKIPDEQQGTARRLFKEAMDRTLDALVAEAQSEAQDYWEEKVYGPWSRDMGRKYPFLTSQDEVSVEQMDAMFRPKTGAIWATRTVLDRMKGYKLRGRQLIEVSPEVQASLVGAEILRDALYPPDGETISVGFKVRLIKFEKVRNVALVLGEKRFRLDELPPGQKKSLTWRPAESGKAELSILTVEKEEWIHKSFPETDWGLYRLLWEGTIDADGTHDRLFRFRYLYNVSGMDRQADVEFEIEREASAELFHRELFQEWKPPPGKVGR